MSGIKLELFAHLTLPFCLQDGPVSGIKLELFIFDTFPLAQPGRVALMEVDRAAEFAPVKNAPGRGGAGREATLRCSYGG